MMRDAKATLDHSFMEMRWRALSLAADLDRIHRAADGATVLEADPRLNQLRDALKVLLQSEPDRAAKVQMIFSDSSDGEGTEARRHRGTK